MKAMGRNPSAMELLCLPKLVEVPCQHLDAWIEQQVLSGPRMCLIVGEEASIGCLCLIGALLFIRLSSCKQPALAPIEQEMHSATLFGNNDADITWYQNSNIVPIEQDLLHVGDALALRRVLILRHIFEHHIDKDVKAAKRSHELLLSLHNDPDLGTDASVDQLAGHEMAWIALIGSSLWRNHGLGVFGSRQTTASHTLHEIGARSHETPASDLLKLAKTDSRNRTNRLLDV